MPNKEDHFIQENSLKKPPISALNQRVKLFTSKYNLNKDIIFLLNKNKKFVFINTSFIDSMKYSLTDLKSKEFSDLFICLREPDNPNKIFDQAGKTLWSDEVICYGKDKSELKGKIKITSILDNGENISGYEIIISEINKMKSVSDNIFNLFTKSEKNAGNLPDLIVVTDVSGFVKRAKYFNEENEDFIRLSNIPSKLEELFPPLVIKQIYSALKEISLYKKTIHSELSFPVRNRNRKFNVKIKELEENTFRIFFRDITEEKNIEREFIKIRERFSLVWENSLDGMRLTDEDGNIVAVNPAFCKIFEMEEEKLLGNPFYIVYQNVSKNYEDRINKYRKNFKTRNFIPKRFSKTVLHNGKSLFLAVNFSFVELGSDNPLILGIFRDITDFRRAQEELNKVDRLATIGKMTSFISHEIRNPLASLKNYVDLLMENPEMPENTKPILDVLYNSIKNLNKLLNDVLLFSRDINIIKVEINVCDLVEKACALVKQKIKNRNIIIKNNIKNGTIRGDYVSLQSVFFNLIDNAIYALQDGGKVEINDSIKDRYYQVWIIDNGPGISEKDKIFEAFYSNKKEGTGLGLSITKKIMELHNGKVRLVKSEPGQTIFELLLPLGSNI